MTGKPPERISSYLNYLPAIFESDAITPFLGQFLLAFERVLEGLDEDTGKPSGLGQVIDRVHESFDPMLTEPEFLPWLANWVALSLRDDWSIPGQRRFIARIVPLYRKRGTLDGLRQMLMTYLNASAYEHTTLDVDSLVKIRVWDSPMQIGKVSSIGVDTVIGEPLPHYFEVQLIVTDPGFVNLTRKEAIARAIIEQEKPAHTFYNLTVIQPPMQIGQFSTIGLDTVLTEAD